MCFFCFKQKTAYEMRISDWSSDVCSSDLRQHQRAVRRQQTRLARLQVGVRHYEGIEGEVAVIGILEGPVPLATDRLDGHVGVRGAVDRKSTRLNSSH